MTAKLLMPFFPQLYPPNMEGTFLPIHVPPRLSLGHLSKSLSPNQSLHLSQPTVANLDLLPFCVPTPQSPRSSGIVRVITSPQYHPRLELRLYSSINFPRRHHNNPLESPRVARYNWHAFILKSHSYSWRQRNISVCIIWSSRLWSNASCQDVVTFLLLTYTPLVIIWWWVV